MADLATLKVRVDAADAVRETKRLGDELGRVGREAPKASSGLDRFDREAQDVTRSVGGAANAFRGFRGFVAAAVGSAAVREFVRFADTARLLEGRLKLVTASAEELRQVQDDLFASAQRTRSDYESSVTLYARVARSTRDLGLAQADLLKFTELTQMAIKASGATTVEASAALVQLSQGLAAGTLRGEEFNSVMEQTPGLALAIAQGLGVGVGELRKLAMQGQLTSKEVIDAVLRMDTTIRRDFATAPKTVADAWTQSKNNILAALGDIDRATGASRFFAALARIPGQLANAVNIFGGVPGYLPAEEQARRNAEVAAAATPAGQAARVERDRQSAMEAARREQEKQVAAMRDYADELVKLSSLTRLSATDMQVLRNADASYTNALRDGNLAVADRIRLLERQAGIQGVLGAAQTQALQSRATADLERLRGSLGAGRVTTVGGGINAGMAGAQDVRNMQLAQMKAEIDARGQALQAEYAERERVQQQLANNFRENMQRAMGDVLTQFVTQGKVSLQSMFASVSQMGASMMAQVVSMSMNRALSGLNLGTGATFGIGAGLGIIGMGAQAVFNANARRRQQRQAAEAARVAEEERNRIAAADIMARQNAAKEAEAQRMRDFIAGRTAGRGGVIQSTGQVLQETSASRMIGELVAIRIATTRTADAITSGRFGSVVNAVQGAGEQMADAVDRMLGSRVQALRLTSGAAVTA